jgi:hypothetical protein
MSKSEIALPRQLKLKVVVGTTSRQSRLKCARRLCASSMAPLTGEAPLIFLCVRGSNKSRAKPCGKRLFSFPGSGSSSGENQRPCEAQEVGSLSGRHYDVMVLIDPEAHRLPVEAECTGDPHPDRHGPTIIRRGVPVRSEHRRGGEGPPFPEVVVDKWLKQERISSRRSVRVSQWRELHYEGPDDKRIRRSENHERPTRGPGPGLGRRGSCGGKRKCGADAPDDGTGGARP